MSGFTRVAFCNIHRFTARATPIAIPMSQICLRWRRNSAVRDWTASAAMGAPQETQRPSPAMVCFPQLEQKGILAEYTPLNRV